MKHILAFQVSGRGDELEVHMDTDGLDTLIANLEQVKEGMAREGKHHVHLLTEDWGGCELRSESVPDGMSEVKKVTLFGWPDAQEAKQ